MKRFFHKILSSEDPTSSKRLVTLIISLHFIIACFAVLFICFYVIFYLPRGRVEPELVAMLKQVLEYDFYIILAGLGFITADSLGQIMLERVKAKVAGDVAISTPTNIASVTKVDNIKVEQNAPIEPEPEQKDAN